MRHLALLALAPLLAFPNAAHADPTRSAVVVSCNVLMDKAGDVTLNAAGKTEHIDDEHLDVQSVDVIAGSSAFRVEIYDTALAAHRRGTWTLTFSARSATGKTAYVARASMGAWTDPPGTPAFSAGVIGRDVPVRGSVDVEESTVTVEVPHRLLGKAGRKGTRLGYFAVEAQESFASLPSGTGAAAHVRLRDDGASRLTWRVGESCGNTTTPPWGPPPGHGVQGVA